MLKLRHNSPGVAPAGAAAVKGKVRSLWWRLWRSRTLYLLLLPVLFGAVLFEYFPAATALYRSLFAWDGRRAFYVGLANFRFFFSDPRLWIAWRNVLQLLAFGVIVAVTMPPLAAYLIFHLRNDTHRYWYRVLFVTPIVVPGTVQIILWRWFYSLNGAINIILRAAGAGAQTRVWLGEPATALYALMFMGFPWVGTMTMLIYLAGFMAIPNEILDAAKVDGATGLKRVWHVELPLVRGQMKLVVMLAFIGTLQDFQTQLIMTNGGPGWATMVPGLRMYQAAMVDFDLGYAAAIGAVLFVVILTLTMINQRYIRGSRELGLL